MRVELDWGQLERDKPVTNMNQGGVAGFRPGLRLKAISHDHDDRHEQHANNDVYKELAPNEPQPQNQELSNDPPQEPESMPQSERPDLSRLLRISRRPMEVFLRGKYKQQSCQKHSERPVPDFLPPDMAQLFRTKQYAELYRRLESVSLTPLELEQLLLMSGNYTFIYKMVQRFRNVFDYAGLSIAFLERLLLVLYMNFDYTEFERIFSIYLSRVDDPDPDAFRLALRVYLRTENVSVASQIFNQTVMSCRELSADILDSYLKDLQQTTSNPSLCYMAYRLWHSRGHSIHFRTRVLIYKIMMRHGTREQEKWVIQHMEDTKSHKVWFLDELDEIETGRQAREYISTVYVEWVERLEPEECECFRKECIDMLMRVGEVSLARRVLEDAASDAEFKNLLRRVLWWIQRDGQPEVYAELLLKVAREAGLEFQEDYFYNLWKTYVAAYPMIRTPITRRFVQELESSDNFSLQRLAHVIRLDEKTGKHRLLRRSIVGDRAEPVLPRMKAIDSRMRNGIWPHKGILTTALKTSRSIEEVEQLVSFIRSNPKIASLDEPSLKMLVFLKRKTLSPKFRLGTFKFLSSIVEGYRDSLTVSDYTNMLLDAVKFHNREFGMVVMDRMTGVSPRSNTELLRAVYAIIKFYLEQGRLDLAIDILEQLKKDKTFYPTDLFMRNTKSICELYAHNLDVQDSDEIRQNLVIYLEHTINVLRNQYDHVSTQHMRKLDEYLEKIGRWRELVQR
ncbi:hypothetical protein KL910_000960 [Ogataea haglerorum]|nr:hypothetical protein KL910_000960 [Ogataea haglerorum]KAG7793116.1 hypothetical protein KL945_000221 [Ogataea haglerorum]